MSEKPTYNPIEEAVSARNEKIKLLEMKKNEGKSRTTIAIENEAISPNFYNTLDSFFDSNFHKEKIENRKISYNYSLGQTLYFNKTLEISIFEQAENIKINLAKDDYTKKFIIDIEDLDYKVEVFPGMSRKVSREMEETKFTHRVKHENQYRSYPQWTETLEINELKGYMDLFNELAEKNNTRCKSLFTANT